MDEILASIRSIIAEEPLSAHQLPVPPERRLGTMGRSTMVAGGKSAPQNSDAKLRPAASSPQNFDDVLDELLVPGERLGSPADTSRRVRSAPDLGPIGHASGAYGAVAAAAPPGATRNLAAAVTQIEEPVEAEQPVKTPRVEIVPEPAAAAARETATAEGASAAGPAQDLRTAEDVLGALAAGLAAATAIPEPAQAEPAARGVADQSAADDTASTPAVAAFAPAATDIAVTTPSAAAVAAVGELAAPDAAPAGVAAEQRVVETATAMPIVAAAAPPPAAGVSDPLPVADSVRETVTEPATVPPVAVPINAAPEIIAMPPAQVAPAASAETFEETVAGMLRPLLREWIDTNMPRMMEKALKEELAASGSLLAHTGSAKPTP